MPTGQMPVGTITFLFTDIVGSTKLWEEHREAIQVALARHDRLMADAIAGQNGCVFKTVGDSVCSAFASARDAVAAALSAQLALASEPWPAQTPIKARMAIHCGAAECRDDDYFGPPVNRVARLLAVGHGGQVLLSAAAQELVRDDLPDGAALKCLGEHRLKDLGRPETAFQLLHPSLPSEFPPLRSLDNPALRHNLPQQLTSFVGREAQVAEVKRMLGVTRLLTLTGSGGSGKTRLALQVAADILDGTEDGVWLAELAPLTDPVLVALTVAASVGVKEEAGKRIVQTLTDSIKGKNMVIVLDNCEHLLDAAARLANDLLRECPGVRILATSREPLGITGETSFRVPSLSQPDPAHVQPVDSLSQYEAVRLFIERAVQVNTAFVVTNDNAPALASICHRLDGIPLAIELAAARVRSLSLEEIDGRLDERFRLLTGGSRTALPRQQTLRGLIDWSFDLLDGSERAMLSRLSVFHGGWTLEAAEECISGEPIEKWQVVDLIDSLCNKSLVASDMSVKEVRYRMLETIRQYSKDRLSESDDTSTWRNRHLNYYLAMAEEANSLNGVDQQKLLQQLEMEHDNMRAALEWCAAAEENREAGLRLAAALSQFWQVRGHLTEGRERLATALRGDRAVDSTTLARAFNEAGSLNLWIGDYAAARGFYEESLALRRKTGSIAGVAVSLQNLGTLEMQLGNLEEAKNALTEGLALFREADDRDGVSMVLNNLGLVLRNLSDYAGAQRLFEECVAICRELENKRVLSYALNNLATIRIVQLDYRTARPLLQESLALKRDLGDRQAGADSLDWMAAAFAEEGEVIRACRLWGAAERIREDLGADLKLAQQVGYHERVGQARAALGDDGAFESAWSEGRAMSFEQAVEFALGE